MVSIGKGVKEIRIHCDNEYRIIYVAQKRKLFTYCMLLLKKTQQTSNKDIELAKNNFKKIP
jgi:phage-related protein